MAARREIKSIGIIVFVVALSHSALAQNLIPDSSFEKNKAVPIFFSGINLSNSWNMPSRGTSDLFCKCERKYRKLSLVNVPQNPMGQQDPHSGSCYAGLFAHSHGAYREYIQTPLKEPLQKNKCYILTMYLSLADYSRATVDQLGVCFLTTEARYKFSNVIEGLDPVYVNIENEIGKENLNWHRISINYAAEGEESYLLIGSFEINRLQKTKIKAPKEARSRINQSTERDAYYFFDDISLVENPVCKPIEITDSISAREPEIPKVLSQRNATAFKNVLFETKKNKIASSYYPELDSLAKYLIADPELRLEITGHCDSTGNESQNKKLSQKRAKTILNHLVEAGVDKTQITFKGIGSLKPAASNKTNNGRSQNRRVEFIITRHSD